MTETPGLSKSFTLVWTIKNADRLFKEDFTYSPCFSLQPATNILCYFIIGEENPDGFTEVMLRHLEDRPLLESDVFECEVSVLNDDGSIFKTVSGRRKIISQGGFSFPLMKTDELVNIKEELYPDNNLVLCCRLRCYGTAIQTNNLCYGLTTLSHDCETFYWCIRNFSSLKLGQTRSKCLKSNIRCPSITVNIFLMKDGDNLQIQFLRDYSKMEFVTKWRVAIMNMGRILHFKSILWDVTEKKFSFNLTHFIKKSELLAKKTSFLQNDTLILEFNCRLLQKSSYVLDFQETKSSECNNSDMGSNKNCHQSNCPSSLSMDMLNLYKDGFNSDVSFQVGYQNFPAHKAILSARSFVFKIMFTVDMKEEKCIKLKNIDPDTFRRLLEFIYAETIEDQRYNSVVSLYSAANEYGVANLRNKCSEILKYKISIANACELLDLADMHGDKQFKNFVESFFLDQGYEMFRSKEWEVFRENNLSLASDIMQKILLQLT